jgi:hypothetical protein
MKAVVRLLIIVAAACLAACASSKGVDKAFSDNRSSLQGNSHSFHSPPELTLHVVTGTLVQKGFAIEQTDAAMGLVKASRNLTDPKDPHTNYHINATAYVSAAADGDGSIVSLAASQQTVLYRQGHHWDFLPLLPIFPIPTSRKFETVVTGEGSIVQGDFYGEFFAAVEQGLAAAAAASARKPAAPGTSAPTTGGAPVAAATGGAVGGSALPATLDQPVQTSPAVDAPRW